MKRSFWKYLSISLILFAIGLVLGFGEKAGWFQSFNVASVKWASSLRSSYLNPYFIGVDKFADTFYDIGVGLTIIVIFSLLKRWKEPLELFFSLIFAGISIEVLKLAFRVPRPHFSWLVNASSYSYPSGHSVGAIALYGLLAYMITKTKMPKSLSYTLSTILWIFAASILFDRLYVGVHWGMDVIGGAIIGFACLILAVGIVENMKKAKEVQESK